MAQLFLRGVLVVVASTDQKARLLDLFGSVVEDVREGRRDGGEVADVLQAIKNDRGFHQALLPVHGLAQNTTAIREILKEWQIFDRRFFAAAPRYTFDALRIPSGPAEFSFPVVDAPSITANTIVDRMRQEGIKHWLVQSDLDVVLSDRQPVSGPYVVLFRQREEADEELLGKSVDVLSTEHVPCITLAQRLRFGFFYWALHGTHLDRQMITLCAGSRFVGGDVPGVRWGGDRVYVDRYSPRDANPRWRARSAVY